MPTKNKILIVLILLMAGILSGFAYLIYQGRQSGDQILNSNSQVRESESYLDKVEEKKENQTAETITEDQMRKEIRETFASPIQIFKAKLISIEENKINVLLESGNETTLMMSEDEIFFKRKFEKDGASITEDIDLSSFEMNKEVEIQYNKEKEEVISISILS